MNYFQFIVLLFSIHSFGQVLGCTDTHALNYNPKATQNNGSCAYKNKTITLKNSVLLSNKLIETSGLIYWNKTLITHNDDTDTNLYALDTITGNITQEYYLPNTVNTDWEEITQDNDHIYIGDFGNNAHGNRTDLHIVIVEKESLLIQKPKIEYITFKYPNQTNFSKQKPNTTNFDCEAFIVTQDSIFLFTKEWESKQTTIYTLPKIPGNYTAIKQESFNIKGLVTGANYLPEKQKLALCGYTQGGHPFIYLFSDFENTHFFSGNKRKINLKPRFYQIEAITTTNGIDYYITNENLKFLTINHPQKMTVLRLND